MNKRILHILIVSGSGLVFSLINQGCTNDAKNAPPPLTTIIYSNTTTVKEINNGLDRPSSLQVTNFNDSVTANIINEPQTQPQTFETVKQTTEEITLSHPQGESNIISQTSESAPYLTNIEKQITPVVPPQIPNLSPAIREIIEMVQAGVSEELVLKYIEKSDLHFYLRAEEIVYLKDIGVPESVIHAIVERSIPKSPMESKTPETPSTVSEPSGPVYANSVAAPQAPPPPPQGSVAGPAEPTTSTTYNFYYFYYALAPYGSWIYLDDLGWCWRPTVAVTIVDWRPYCHGGYWIYTDLGWYWYSTYSWGSIAFHYGRWHHHPRFGWIWVPGYVWAPAWVVWRYSPHYIGWAPMPPGSYWAGGIGFVYSSSMGFSFGSTWFTFVSWDRFCDKELHKHRLPKEKVETIYKDSLVINNFIQGDGNTIINAGLPADHVEKFTGKRVPQFRIREISSQSSKISRPELIDSRNNQILVRRPTLEADKPGQLRLAKDNPPVPVIESHKANSPYITTTPNNEKLSPLSTSPSSIRSTAPPPRSEQPSTHIPSITISPQRNTASHSSDIRTSIPSSQRSIIVRSPTPTDMQKPSEYKLDSPNASQRTLPPSPRTVPTSPNILPRTTPQNQLNELKPPIPGPSSRLPNELQLPPPPTPQPSPSQLTIPSQRSETSRISPGVVLRRQNLRTHQAPPQDSSPQLIIDQPAKAQIIYEEMSPTTGTFNEISPPTRSIGARSPNLPSSRVYQVNPPSRSSSRLTPSSSIDIRTERRISPQR